MPTSLMLMQAPTAPPPALAAAGQPRGDTQFSSNTDYQRELQQLIEERGGLKSLLPGVSPAPSDKSVGLPADLYGHHQVVDGSCCSLSSAVNCSRRCCQGQSPAMVTGARGRQGTFQLFLPAIHLLPSATAAADRPGQAQLSREVVYNGPLLLSSLGRASATLLQLCAEVMQGCGAANGSCRSTGPLQLHS